MNANGVQKDRRKATVENVRKMLSLSMPSRTKKTKGGRVATVVKVHPAWKREHGWTDEIYAVLPENN